MLTQVAQRANVYMRYISEGVANIIKNEVIKSYGKAITRSKPNTPATLFYKRNPMPLVDTGALFKSMQSPDIKFYESSVNVVGFGNGWKSIVELRYTVPDAGSQCFLDSQERHNPDYVYLWTHEFGARPAAKMYKFGIRQFGHFSVPKRAFFKDGLMNGMREGLVYSSFMINQLATWYRQMPTAKFTTPSLGLERETRFTGQDLVMVSAPPSMMYAGIGGGLDYFNMLKGSFHLNNFEQWFMQMGKGSVGATRLSQRRQMRKRLWK